MFAGRVDDRISADRVEEAARIWAAATAARDGEPGPRPIQLARRRLADVLSQRPGAVLLTALSVDDRPVGFAAAAPITGTRAELHHLGVDPAEWGEGIGTRLLHELVPALRSRGHSRAELWVYEGNSPAVALYERCGWRLAGCVRTHPTSSRTEHRYVLQLA